MNANRAILLLILFGAAAAAGYGLLRGVAPARGEQKQERAAEPTPANIVRYEPGAAQLSFLKIEPVAEHPQALIDPLNARVAYDEDHTVRVFSPIAGRVTRIDAQPGIRVSQGQPLAWLDAPDFASAVADARKAELDLAQRKLALNRAKDLYEGEVLARKDYEAAQTDYREAEVEVERTRARVRNLAHAGMGEDGRFALRAPIAGMVLDRQINPGSEVRPDAATPLFVISDLSRVWVMIDLPERDLDKVRAGQSVIVEVDAFPGKQFRGQVAHVGRVLDPATRRIQARCTVANLDGLLRPEMYARVAPLAAGGKQQIRIPNSALITQGVMTFVFVETAPGVLERRRVSLGLQGHTDSFVQAGLASGDKVVVSGALLLNSELRAGS